MARVAPLHFGRVEDALTFRGHEYEAFRKKHELRGWASSEKTKKWVNYAYHLSSPSSNVFTDVQRSGQCPTVV